MNDNRNYKYKSNSVTTRREFKIISSLVTKGSSVIDLGSGDGSLLKLLKNEKQINGCGIEISASGVASAKKKGIKSYVGRIDTKLPFKNKEFDYAVCNVTMHCVMFPEILIKEMVRISKKQIITFPNFAFFVNRLEMLILGRMPKMMLFGYEWFSTGEIHQLSINDFKKYCQKEKIQIVNQVHLGPGKFFSGISSVLVKVNPNLFAMLGVFVTKKG